MYIKQAVDFAKYEYRDSCLYC